MRWVSTVNPARGEPFSGSAQQQHVLEHAAGEPHQPHRPGDPRDDLGDGVRHRQVERRTPARRGRHLRAGRRRAPQHRRPGRARRRGRARTPSRWQPRPAAGCIPEPRSQQWCHSCNPGGGRCRGERLELRPSRPGLVDRFVPDSQQGGDRVEEAAHARASARTPCRIPVATSEPQLRRRAARRPAAGPASQAIPATHRCASAIRHGLRTAASPPGSGTGDRCATRVNRWLSGPRSEDLAAPDRFVAAVAGAVERDTDDRLTAAARARPAATTTCAWWC